MVIPDAIRKCVAFIGPRRDDGQIDLRGTGFFIGRPIPELKASVHYFITARHVLEGILKMGANQALLRLNLKNGQTRTVDIPLDNWTLHPDPLVDVAAVSLGIDEDVDHLLYPIDDLLTDEEIKKKEIGVGEDVFITGLFVHHQGQQRNIPIVRVGNIAALREEQVSSKAGLMDAYLIEARSIGGLSGSPVFVHLGVIRAFGGVLKYNVQNTNFHMLGLMHGHWDTSDSTTADAATVQRAQSINMGIAIVVPAEKILEVLNLPELKKREEAEVLRWRAGLATDDPSPTPPAG